jgi:hypothetical protein
MLKIVIRETLQLISKVEKEVFGRAVWIGLKDKVGH